MPTRFYSYGEVLAIAALAFVLGMFTVGVPTWWPLISQTLFPQ